MNLSSFQASCRSEKGVTLIEVVVVMAIIAILSMTTIGIIVSLFDSSIRTAKYLDQNTTIETMYGFLASRLSVTQVGMVGHVDPSTNKINPLTLSGDQFVFQSGGGSANNNIVGSLCYRIFYLDEPIDGSNVFTQGDAIWVATAPDCDSIMPTRGPNQNPASAPEPDPVLDATTPMGTPFVLAGKIKSTNPQYNTPGGPNQCNGANDVKSFSSPLQFFIFCSGALEPLTVDSQASTDNPENIFYDNPANVAQIRGVQSLAYIDSGNAPKVPMRAYSQVFSLGQVQLSCAIQGGGDPIEVEIPQPEGWRNIATAGNPSFAAGWVNLRDSNAAYSSIAPAAFYKDAFGVVHLRGSVIRTSGTGTIIFTLPAAYRPAANQSLSFLINGNTFAAPQAATITIQPSGQVQYPANNTTNGGALDGISFRP